MEAALRDLFGEEGFPVAYSQEELRYERDEMGKPYVVWEGSVAEWAEERGRDWRHLQISNTHDGGIHLLIAAYAPTLVGLGIDAVYLPRLDRPDRDSAYFRRFATHFMSATEREAFEAASAQDDLATLRLRVAAHFSLMEAASKACGTGLKIGGGMGRETSLPKQSLGVLSLGKIGSEEIDSEQRAVKSVLLCEGEAISRLEALGVQQIDAYYGVSTDFLVSVVVFKAPQVQKIN